MAIMMRTPEAPEDIVVKTAGSSKMTRRRKVFSLMSLNPNLVYTPRMTKKRRKSSKRRHGKKKRRHGRHY